MKPLFKNPLLTCLLTLAAFAIFTSCMPEASEPASQLVIGVQVNDIDSTLKADNDSLTVEEIRFIHGKSFFTISEDSTIQLTGRAHQLSYKGTTRQGTQLIYPFPPGAPSPFPEGVYQGLTF